ncbi:MAG: hypothetical protein WDN69_31590 [Aliidongia sp.]
MSEAVAMPPVSDRQRRLVFAGLILALTSGGARPEYRRYRPCPGSSAIWAGSPICPGS